MDSLDLRSARKRIRLTQEQMAAKLGVTQAYLSMIESHRRVVPEHQWQAVVKMYGLSPALLSFHRVEKWGQMNGDKLAIELACLGYPGFAYLNKRQPTWNPAELLLAALNQSNLETRVTEALPWLVFQYSELDWAWAVREAKLNNVTNRLGFVVSLARELAEQQQALAAAKILRRVEAGLEPAVLRKQETLCHDNMTQAERRWLMDRSTSTARRWNVLSDLSLEQLSHAI